MIRRIGLLGAFLALTVLGCQNPLRKKCEPAPITLLRDLEDTDATVPVLNVEMKERLKQQSHIARVAHHPPSRQFNHLVLSGGGAYGAFSAGVLVGLSETGARPKFDVITGVSTGSMVATLAFVGPSRDCDLRRLYTTLSNRDIYRMKFEPFALFTESLADSTPLRKVIEGMVDEQLLKEVAAEHAKGRSLYVGTTQLDARRLVVWDMGAIASRGDTKALELFRQIILASAAIPGFFPPVPIQVEIDGKPYEELHVDGGVTASLFYRSPRVPKEVRPLLGENPLADSNLYVIVAGKLYDDPTCVQRRFAQIADSAISALLHAQTRADLVKLFTLCLVTGMNYRLTAVPASERLNPSSTEFDPREMTRLFELGRAQAKSENFWRDTPPGLERGEGTPSRAGTRFATPESVPLLQSLKPN